MRRRRPGLRVAPASYLKKYPHSKGGVLCFEGSKQVGDYHQNMDGDVFTDWMNVVLLPALAALGEEAVVIMDNAPYQRQT